MSIGPAVAAENPDALANQCVGHGAAGCALRTNRCQRASPQNPLRARAVHRCRLRSVCRLRALLDDQLQSPTNRREPARAPVPRRKLFCWSRRGAYQSRTPRCLRRASWTRSARGLLLLAVGRGGQVAAVDRRAAGGVGDHRAIAEELGQQLDVGVSPHPEQAPENSKSGCRSCMSFTCRARACCDRPRAVFRKYSQLSRSASRSGGCGTMLMALCLTSLLLLTGQTSTQSAQPVQSSGATCSVYSPAPCPSTWAWPHLNVAGALSAR